MFISIESGMFLRQALGTEMLSRTALDEEEFREQYGSPKLVKAYVNMFRRASTDSMDRRLNVLNALRILGRLLPLKCVSGFRNSNSCILY